MREGEPKEFLEEKYPDLQQSSEVESAVRRHEVRTGEKAKQQPKERIEAYLDRLEEVFNPGNPDKRERRVDILKDKLHELFIIKPEEIPESYFNNQKKIAREQGHGDIEITDEIRKQSAEVIVNDQEKSLDTWVDYLGSEDAMYPNWLKYFAFRSITKLSEYDKEKKEFKKRSKGTTAPFPDINREALAYVLDAVEKSHKREAKEGATDEQWEKLLKTANFGKLYGYAIEHITPASQEEKENIQGEWVKYEQGSDAEPLYKSLQGHGTGWCTAGEGVAKTQLEAGDFYVYYTESKKGKVPRVAIRMQNGEIAEVRGINADQNLEPVMADIVKERVKDLPGAEKYERKAIDMKRLTDVEKKIKSVQELTVDDLKFLYEIDGEIQGFGFYRDPRIEELQKILHEGGKIVWSEEKMNDETIGLLIGYSFDCGETFQQRSKMPEKLLFIKGKVDFRGAKIKSLGNLQAIWGLVSFSDSEIEDIGQLREVRRAAYFKGSKIKSLGQLRSIGGGAHFEDSEVEDLGQLQEIGESATFCRSKIKSLGQLKKIGGNALLYDSEVEDLGQLQEVGGYGSTGEVYIDKNSKLDFSKVKIGGKIIRE